MTVNTIKTPNTLSTRLEKIASPLATLDIQLKQNIALNALVQPRIMNLASVNVTVTRYQAGVLDLCVDNQSIANHLHYLKNLLIAELSQLAELSDLQSITSFVYQPENRFQTLEQINKNNERTESEGESKTKPTISKDTANIISLIANDCISHEPLQDAMKKLADNMRRQPDY